MGRDNIEAPWIGDDDYGNYDLYGQEEYDYDKQDDLRDQIIYEEMLAKMEKNND